MTTSNMRWKTIVIFCLFTFLNGFSWLMFDPAVRAVHALFGPALTDHQLTLLSAWQPIIYILTCGPLTALLIKPDGIRRTVRIGAAMAFAGAFLKLWASAQVPPYSAPLAVISKSAGPEEASSSAELVIFRTYRRSFRTVNIGYDRSVVASPNLTTSQADTHHTSRMEHMVQSDMKYVTATSETTDIATGIAKKGPVMSLPDEQDEAEAAEAAEAAGPEAPSVFPILLLHFGQILCAIASPIAIGAPALLSATWFPAHQRTRATACAVVFNNVGNCMAYVLIPPLANGIGFRPVMIFEALLSVLSVLLVFTSLPPPPSRHLQAEDVEVSEENPTVQGIAEMSQKKSQAQQRNSDSLASSSDNLREQKPGVGTLRTAASDPTVRVTGREWKEGVSGARSPTQSPPQSPTDTSGLTAASAGFETVVTSNDFHPKEEGTPFVADVKALLKCRSALLLCAVYAWTSGGYVAWMSLFDQILGETYDDDFVGIIACISTVAYIVGGLANAQIIDLYLRRRMKHVILVCTLINVVACGLFVMSLRLPGWWPDEPLIGGGMAAVVFFSMMAGACSGAAAPAFYELAAEVSYPVSEGVSGGAMSLSENVGALIMYEGIFRVLGLNLTNVAYVVGLVGACVLASLVKEEHRRSDYMLVMESRGSTKGEAPPIVDYRLGNGSVEKLPAGDANEGRPGAREAERHVV